MTKHEFLRTFYCYEALGYFGDDFIKGLKIISKYTDKIVMPLKSSTLAKVAIEDLLNNISFSDIRELHNRDWTIEDETYLIYKDEGCK